MIEQRILLNARTDEVVGSVEYPEGTSEDVWRTSLSGYFECYWKGTDRPVLDIPAEE